MIDNTSHVDAACTRHQTWCDHRKETKMTCKCNFLLESLYSLVRHTFPLIIHNLLTSSELIRISSSFESSWIQSDKLPATASDHSTITCFNPWMSSLVMLFLTCFSKDKIVAIVDRCVSPAIPCFGFEHSTVFRMDNGRCDKIVTGIDSLLHELLNVIKAIVGEKTNGTTISSFVISHGAIKEKRERDRVTR